MKKKILITSTELMMLHFLIPHVKYLIDNGYTVEIACSEVGGRFCDLVSLLGGLCRIHSKISSQRTPITLKNIQGFIQLKKIINNGNYDLIWTNEPVMGVITRMAANKSRKKKTSVIYFAHGFHFFKGAPLINWLIYYPIEWLCSFITDVLVTINHEDYNLAKKRMHTKRIEYIPGIGINTEKFSEVSVVDRDKKREELGIPKSAIVLLSVGELSKRKNHEVIIRSLVHVKDENIHYYIVGKGKLENYLKDLAKKVGVVKRVHLLGYRSDIPELCFASDIFVFPSIREGLGIAALEAMCMGLPILTSNVQGIVDYSINGVTGYVCSPHDVDGFSVAINNLTYNTPIRQNMGKHNKVAVLSYDILNVKWIIEKIFH